MHYSSDMIAYKTFQQFRDFIPTFLSGIITFFGMYRIVMYLQGNSFYMQIGIATFFGIIIYLLLNFFLKSAPMLFALKLLQERKI
jgi:hypothetical protein